MHYKNWNISGSLYFFLFVLMDKKNNYHGIILISVVIISLATITGSYFISKTNFSIQNTGTATTMDGRLSNTIAVNGDGKVFATPDMVRIDISVSELASTSKVAQSKVNDKISQVLNVLKTNGIPEKDIQTQSKHPMDKKLETNAQLPDDKLLLFQSLSSNNP